MAISTSTWRKTTSAVGHGSVKGGTAKLEPIALTRGPEHHYFGYYGICPWDISGRYVLSLETPFADRAQRADDSAVIGMVDTESGNTFIALERTRAWNWQQGCFAQWLPGEADTIIYNDYQQGEYVSVILNVKTRTKRLLSRALAALSSDGRYGLSLNFSRLYDTRPGYGYANTPDAFASVRAPEDDGIYLVDIATGSSRLIVSLADVAGLCFGSAEKTPKVWFNHLQFNTDHSRFVFLMRYCADNNPPWLTGMFTADLDGGNVYPIARHTNVSHFDWRDSRHILAWTYREEHGDAFYLCEDKSTSYDVVGLNYLTEDGHCCYSPDRRWFVDDTYPDAKGYQTLKLWDIEQGREIILGRYHSPEAFTTGDPQLRCDLHPRWSRDGKKLCFDSTMDGTRQVYVLDLKPLGV